MTDLPYILELLVYGYEFAWMHGRHQHLGRYLNHLIHLIQHNIKHHDFHHPCMIKTILWNSDTREAVMRQHTKRQNTMYNTETSFSVNTKLTLQLIISYKLKHIF